MEKYGSKGARCGVEMEGEALFSPTLVLECCSSSHKNGNKGGRCGVEMEGEALFSPTIVLECCLSSQVRTTW